MEYSKGDTVLSHSNYSKEKEGIVHKVYDYGVSVNFGTSENPYFEVFHFKPTHHMQTPINQLELIQKSKTGSMEEAVKKVISEAIQVIDINKIAETLVTSHPDFAAEGMTDYQNGRFNGIIEGIEYMLKNHPLKK